MKDTCFTYFALDILCLIGSLCLTNPGESRYEALGHFVFCMKNFVCLFQLSDKITEFPKSKWLWSAFTRFNITLGS